MSIATYEETPYPCFAHEASHPDRLATVARLHGLSPPPLATARVLEIGCGDGGNLLPMAAGLPAARFVGVDYAPGQIAAGQARVTRLGLRNVELLAADVRDLSAARLGTFDYIISHGVYAWVPADVQDALLRLTRAALNQGGVAYVSYNTYPGSHARDMVRDMLLFHTRSMTGAAQRARQGRALLRLLTQAAPPTAGAYASAIHEEERRFGRMSDGNLLHDDMNEDWCPVYFHQFVTHAESHRLRFLAEAIYSSSSDGAQPPAVQQMLRQCQDRLTYEQYLDFAIGRAFRRTLLCREEDRPQDVVTPARILEHDLRARARYQLVGGGAPDPAPEVAAQFRSLDESSTVSVAGAPKAALWHLLTHAPRALTVAELRAGLGPAAPPAEDLARLILALYGGRMVELYGHAPPLTGVTERPYAGALQRLQAREGKALSNLWHENVDIKDPLALALVQECDGTQDHDALRARLLQRSIAEGLELPPVDDDALEQRADALPEAEAQERIAAWLGPALERCARFALLQHPPIA